MKFKILILCIVILVLLSACGTPANCSTGGPYYFTPLENCVLGFVW